MTSQASIEPVLSWRAGGVSIGLVLIIGWDRFSQGHSSAVSCCSSMRDSAAGARPAA